MNHLVILFDAANTHPVLALVMACLAVALAVVMSVWLKRAWLALRFGGGFWHYDRQAKDIARRIRARWKKLSLDCGFATQMATDTKGHKHVEIIDAPEVVGHRLTPYGFVLRVVPVKRDLGPADMVSRQNLVQARVIRLAKTEFRGRSPVLSVEVSEQRNGEVNIDVYLRDLLASTFRLPEATGDNSYVARLGVNEAGQSVTYDLLRNAQHMAFEAMTRGGKTMLAYVIVSQICHNPNVLIAGIDATGLLLGACKTLPRPELRCVSRDSTEQLRTLQRIISLMEQETARLMLSTVDNAPEPTSKHPLVFVSLEEYPGMIAAARDDDAAHGRKPAERIAPKIEAAVKRLARESAKANFRMLILAQRFSSTSIDTDLRSNLGLRVTFREDNADSVRMLFDDISPMMMKRITRFRPGEGLIALPDGNVEHFRAYYLPYEQYVTRVKGVGGASVSESRQAQQPKTIGGYYDSPLMSQVTGDNHGEQ